MTDKNSSESVRISPVAGGGTRRSRLWAWVGWALPAVLLLILGAVWWLWPLVPPRQTVQPDSPEAWRALMRSESRPVHLAAAILLASKGDAEGTKALLEAFPSLTKEEEHIALQALLGVAVKKDLDPTLIEAFLNHPESCKTGDPAAVLNLIPPGQKARYLQDLLMILDRATPSSRSWDGEAYSMTFWPAIKAIMAAGNREALEHCRKAIPKALKFRAQNGNYYIPWRLADFLLAYYAENPVEGFRSIEKEYPSKRVRPVQGYYLLEIAQQDHHKGALDLWLGPLPDDKPTTPGSVLEDWRRLFNDRPSSTSTLRTKLARSIALAWPKIPDEQKNRFCEADRARFSSLFVHFYADQPGWYEGVKPTREMLLLLLKEPSAPLGSLIKRLYDHGERDLRPLLIQEALWTQDLGRARDVLHALHYWFGGIPKEVVERARTLMQAPSSGRDDANRRRDITRYLSEPSPYESKTVPRPPNPPYGDSRIPWALRRNQTGKALAQMQALQTAVAAYMVDYNWYPPGLASLTTPIAYVKTIPPDVCAGSGAYGYTESCGWQLDYALASAGPDGVRDISRLHFLLTQDVLGVLPGAPGKTPYVRLTPRGYEFLETFSPGADIVLVFDRSIYDKKKFGGPNSATVLIP